jgi:hypothetical protein
MAKAANAILERDLDFMEQEMTKQRTKRFRTVSIQPFATWLGVKCAA